MRRNRLDMIAETRAKLIAAARDAFAKKGYANSSMDDFAAAVGLTRGAIYHHFGGKKGLFRSVVEQIDTEIDQKIDCVTKDMTSEWARFMAESRIYLLCMLDPEIQQIMMRDGPSVLGDIANWPSNNKYHEMMVSNLQSMMKNKVIRICEPVSLMHQINGALYSAASGIANSQHPEITFENAWQSFSVLMDGLRLENT